MRDQLHAWGASVLRPVVRLLASGGVTPNQLTVSGLILNVAAAALVVGNNLRVAGVVWLFAGLFDMLDGALARAQRKSDAFGAFLDSTLDRLSEGVVFAAVCYHFAAFGQPITAAVAALALLGSLTISYARARAEGLGAHCRAGLLTRTERVVLLGFGLCFGLLELVIYLLAVLTLVTVVQRIWLASRELLSR